MEKKLTELIAISEYEYRIKANEAPRYLEKNVVIDYWSKKMQEAYNLGKEEGENKEGWISAKERLPDKKGYYLTVVDEIAASKTRGSIEIQDLYESVDFKAAKAVLKFQDYVTHWQPLPSEPILKPSKQ